MSLVGESNNSNGKRSHSGHTYHSHHFHQSPQLHPIPPPSSHHFAHRQYKEQQMLNQSYYQHQYHSYAQQQQPILNASLSPRKREKRDDKEELQHLQQYDQYSRNPHNKPHHNNSKPPQRQSYHGNQNGYDPNAYQTPKKNKGGPQNDPTVTFENRGFLPSPPSPVRTPITASTPAPGSSVPNEQLYAGAGFSHSPAPHTLPLPSFSSPPPSVSALPPVPLATPPPSPSTAAIENHLRKILNMSVSTN